MRKSIFNLVLISSFSLSGCSTIMNNLPGVYTLEIQQGNIIDQEIIDQLRPHMTKRQVLYVMGSSMLIDVFHQKRWDYIYSEQPSGGDRTQKRISLFFDGDLLSNIQGDIRPSTLPVRKKLHTTTLDIPKRHLDNTLWGRFMRSFDRNEPITTNENDLEDLVNESQINL